MSEQGWVAIIVGGLSVFGTIAAAALLYIRSRGDSKIKLNEYIDARVTQQLKDAYVEVDALKGKIEATGRVWTAISQQAPTGWRPTLDPEDVRILDDTIPHVWRTQRLA